MSDATAPLRWVSASRRRFTISFSRARTAIAPGSRSLRAGRFRLAVRMLCSSSASAPGCSASQRSSVTLEDHAERVGRDRQRLVVVADEERAVAIGELQLLPLEHRAVLIAEDRNQDLVGELVLDRVPLDVEEAREARARPVFEHVQPPRVRRLRDAHVVRDQIHHVPHAARVQRVDPRPVLLVGADLRVEARGIGDVVAVRAAGHRLQIRRGVAIADAEVVQIVHDRAGVTEGEAAVELQAIRGKRDARDGHHLRQ